MLKNPLHTLRGRLATTYACLAVLGVATSALYTASTVRSGLHDRVVLDLADEARLLAQDVSGPLSRGDIDAVDDFVGRAGTLTHARLMVVGRAGDVVAMSRGWSNSDEDGSLAAALLGKTVESVAVHGEEALVVQFSDDETLTIIVDDAPYECFTVNGPGGLLVV